MQLQEKLLAWEEEIQVHLQVCPGEPPMTAPANENTPEHHTSLLNKLNLPQPTAQLHPKSGRDVCCKRHDVRGLAAAMFYILI